MADEIRYWFYKNDVLPHGEKIILAVDVKKQTVKAFTCAQWGYLQKKGEAGS